jgi:hypothetical protein
MVSSGMLRRVALVSTDVSEEISASIIRVTRIIELRSMRRLLVTANVVPSSPIFVTLMMEALRSHEMSVLVSATRRNIPEDAILHSHRHEHLKSYTVKLDRKLTGPTYKDTHTERARSGLIRLTVIGPELSCPR